MNRIQFKGRRIDNDQYVIGSLIERSLRWGYKYSILVLAEDEESDDIEYDVYYPSIEVIYSKDSIINSVVNKIISRSDVGIKKYNVTLDRNDLTLKDWLTHLEEELMDAVNYINRIKKEL